MSTTSTYNLTRDALVRRALRKLGNTNPSNDDITNATEALQIITKRIDVQGKWVWAIDTTESTLTLSANTQSYSTGSDAGNIATNILELTSFDLYIGNIHTPCAIIPGETARTTYLRDTPGMPTAVFLERRPLLTDNKLWVYPPPNQAFTAKYTFRRRIYDFNLVSDNPDFPQEWFDCLTYQLAGDLIEEYGTPEPAASRIIARSAELMKLMKAANAETTTVTSVQTTYF